MYKNVYCWGRGIHQHTSDSLFPKTIPMFSSIVSKELVIKAAQNENAVFN